VAVRIRGVKESRKRNSVDQGDCIFLATKRRIRHEFRELRENNEETTYFAKEATAGNTRKPWWPVILDGCPNTRVLSS
jgi:transposase